MGGKQKSNSGAIRKQTAAIQAQTRQAAKQAAADRRVAVRAAQLDARGDRQISAQIRRSEANNTALLASLDDETATLPTEYIDDTSQSRRRRMAGGSVYGFRRMSGGGLGGPNGTLG